MFLDDEGLFRVKRLFSEIYDGENSFEAGFVSQSLYHSFVMGLGVGSTFGIKPIYLDFKSRFNEFQFQGKSSHARKLLDCTMATCLRNGIRMGMRAGALASLFTGTACTLAVYHNDVRFTDLMIASAATGGLYCFHRGPKATFAGATLFGLAGIPVACLVKLFFWFSGSTYAEFSDRGRQYYDAPAIQKQKKFARTERLWKDVSVTWVDDFKSYIYHQRRVDRLEEMGIVDDSFKRLKPTDGIHPKEFDKVD